MSNSKGSKSVTRQEFLRRFVAVEGVTYQTASKLYAAMVDTIGSAILAGDKVTFGRVLALKPVRRKARKVTSKLGGVNREVHLGDRLVYKAAVYKEFMATHHVDWKL